MYRTPAVFIAQDLNIYPPWCNFPGGHFGLRNISAPESANSSRVKPGLGQGILKALLNFQACPLVPCMAGGREPYSIGLFSGYWMKRGIFFFI